MLPDRHDLPDGGAPHFAQVPEELGLQITVEIQDIKKATYFKHPPGTLGPPSLSIV